MYEYVAFVFSYRFFMFFVVFYFFVCLFYHFSKYAKSFIFGVFLRQTFTAIR